MRSHAKAASAGPIEGSGRGATSTGFLGLFVLAAVLAVLLAPSLARASTGFFYAGEIQGDFGGSARVAAENATGNLLVVNNAKGRVDVYDSGGANAKLLTSFGEFELSGPYGIAIDQSNGDAYVTDPGGKAVRRYTSDGAATPTYSRDFSYSGPAAGSGAEEVGSFNSAIAVDPLNGDLLVADRGNDRVSRFDSTGAFVSSFDGADSPDGAFTQLEDVTLSPAGKIFVTDGAALENLASRVLRFSNAGAYEATLRPLAETGDALLAYDAVHAELVVGDVRRCFFCTTSIHVLDPADGSTIFDASVPAEAISGLASDWGNGRLYVAAPNGENFGPGKVAIYAHVKPDVVLDPPASVTDTSVHLSGTVDPDGLPTEYRFEISKDGGSTWLKPNPDADAGEGTSPVAVETDFTVEPNTEYLARLVATNTEAAMVATPTQAFTTEASAPKVETLAAADISETSAVLNGRINPFGLQTTYYFEYGPTTEYGTLIPADGEATAGQGRVDKFFSRTVFGLAPGTTYHFRLVATNSAGTTFGADQTFATVGASADPVRGYEQVTPADKHGIAVESGYGSVASPDGNALTYIAKASPNSAAIMARLASVRGETDWQGGIGTDPPLAPADERFLAHPTLAVSSDFTHAFVASNAALTPGAIEHGGNLFRVNLTTGAYDFIGGAGEMNTFDSFVGSTTNNAFQDAAPDFSWIVFFSRSPMLTGATENGLYKWSVADGLELLSVLPNGEPARVNKNYAGTIFHAVSKDGSRVYFTTTEGSESVYFREGAGPSTAIAVSHVPGDPSTPQRASLLGTNESGRYAFFVSDTKLTSDAPGDGSDLYRYDASDGSLEYLGARAFLELLDGPDGRISNNGSFGIGADGETIYFNQIIQDPGGTHFDFSVWHEGVTHVIRSGNLLLSEERPSPSGRYNVYYEKVGGVSQVIYRYDAETNEATCVSCRRDGTPVSADLPPEGIGDRNMANQPPRSVIDDGTVYFDTTARLVAADVNGARDVYTWRDGKLTLISPGTGPFDAQYGDASADGSDVFFATAQQLVGRDTDGAYDYYDARLNGGLPAQSPPPPQECLRDDCKQTPNAGPELPFGGSEALSGPENVKPPKHKKCGKGKKAKKVKGKVRCVKKQKASKNKKGGNR